MLSALILVYIAALNFSDKTNHTGSGSTAGVIQYQSKGDTTENIQEEEDMGSQSMMDFNMSSKLHNLKAARQLATEITESGAKLFDFLG